MTIKRDKKALIKDLEKQIDYLVGYAPQSLHWKLEYHHRQLLIDETLTNTNTPPEIVEKIARIQDTIYRMQNNEEHEQGYLQYSLERYVRPAPLHDVAVNNRITGESYTIQI